MEASTQSSVEEDPDSLSETISLLLCSNGPVVPIRFFFCKLALCKFTLDFSLRYINATTAVTLPVFAFSIAFSSPLMVLAAVLVVSCESKEIRPQQTQHSEGERGFDIKVS